MEAHAVGEAGRRCEPHFSREHPMYELFTRGGGESWR